MGPSSVRNLYGYSFRWKFAWVLLPFEICMSPSSVGNPMGPYSIGNSHGSHGRKQKKLKGSGDNFFVEDFWDISKGSEAGGLGAILPTSRRGKRIWLRSL